VIGAAERGDASLEGESIKRYVCLLVFAGIGLATVPTGASSRGFTCGDRQITIQGSILPEKLSGTEGVDVIDGGGGPDEISGGGGDDVICGGGGPDRIFGDDGIDEIYGDAGNDDVVLGQGDNSRQELREFASGGAGDDGLFNHMGQSLNGATLIGGEGNDDVVGVAWPYSPDRLEGGDGCDRIDALAGDDVISTGPACPGGFNHVRGGDGRDTIVGGSDGDVIDGGGQDDTIRAGDGADEIDADAVHLPPGWYGDDTVFGQGGRDVIRGLEGRDGLFGGAGRDDIKGESGADLLGGDADDDNLSGGDGDDQLSGGGGTDDLDGGTGADRCNGEHLSHCER
jgi:Ca2+-binding RTX toxin-like protein